MQLNREMLAKKLSRLTPGTRGFVKKMLHEEKIAHRREQCFAVLKGLKEGGMTDVRLHHVPAMLKDVMTVQHVMRRRTDLVGLYDAAKAFPAVMKFFEEMKHMTPHTVLAAAARRYFAQMERQKWQVH